MPTPQNNRTRVNASDDFGTWALANSKALGIGAAVLVVAGLGIWFYKSSEEKKREKSEQAYYEALRIASAGNDAFALAELRKVATRYSGTNAGMQARMALTRVLFDQGKFQEGIDELKKASPGEHFETSTHVLAAAGYEQLGKFAEAAQEYEQAASKSEIADEKSSMKANAARAYMAANNKDKAVAIWKELAEDEASPASAEARVRLGELTASAATKS